MLCVIAHPRPSVRPSFRPSLLGLHGAGAYPSYHRARGPVHPGYVVSMFNLGVLHIVSCICRTLRLNMETFKE